MSTDEDYFTGTDIPLYNSDVGDSLEAEYEGFSAYLDLSGFEVIGSGSFRIAWMRDNVVIKVPLVADGVMDNRIEAKAWRVYRDRPTQTGICVPPSRLLKNDCLMMAYVEEDFHQVLPEWAERIDCRQVGLYKGRIVAYDFALDLPERAKWEKEWGVYSHFFYSDEWLDIPKREYLKKAIRPYLRHR